MIDYEMIGDASRFYSAKGFARVESPWLVTKEIADITTPPGVSTYIVQKDTEIKRKVFVASGEQSLLYLINKGFLPNAGRVQTITPCMRNDPFDETHTKYFTKLELMHYSTDDDLSSRKNVDLMIDSALSYFKCMVPTSDLSVIESADSDGNTSHDIMLDGIEIGSYGHRSCLFCNWIYGTGLAEPRFSRLLAHRRLKG